MARTLSTGNYLRYSGTPPVVTAPFSMGCWAKVSHGSVAGFLGVLSRQAAPQSLYDLFFYGSGSGGGDNKIYWQSNATGTGGSAVSTAAVPNGSWFHGLGVESATNSRAVYINGGSKGTDTTNATQPTGLDRMMVGGADHSGVNGREIFPGTLAEWALWDAALTDAEATMLSLGVSPLFIRPGNLLVYYPLVGRYSPEIDTVGGFNQTLTGTPAVADHCRVFYPRGLTAKKYWYNVSVSPAVQSVTVNQPARTTTGGATHAAAALSAPVNQPSATITGGSLFGSLAQALTINQPSPAVSEERTVAVDTQAVTVSAQAPTITTGATQAAAAQAVTVNQPTQTPTGGSSYAAAAQAAVVSQPSATITGGATVGTAVQSITIGLESPFVSETTIVSVGTAVLTAGVIAPSIATGANVPLNVRTITISPLVVIAGEPGALEAPGCAVLAELSAEGEMDELSAEGEMEELVAMGVMNEFCCEDC